MKRLIPLLGFLLLWAPALLALDTRTPKRAITIVDDVIKMSQAGVSDDAILSYVIHARDPFDITPDDIIKMTDAKVSKVVIEAMVDESARRKDLDTHKQIEAAPDDSNPYIYPVFTFPYFDPWWFMPRYYTAVKGVSNAAKPVHADSKPVSNRRATPVRAR